MAQARAYHDGCLNATLADPRWERKVHSAASCHTSVALEILRSTDPENELPVTSTSATSDRQYILFFDGGSRGNPGPGGSGAVIVSTNATATTSSIIWSAAMSSAKPTTTNNQAEYCGALEGLRAAQAHQWTPLDVVGDSQLILGQLRRYKAPRNKAPRVLRRSQKTGRSAWREAMDSPLRAYNKMADTAANAAMDSRASSQVHHPTTRADHANLAHHLASDFAQWQAHHFARLHVQ
jgi:ribonuclease HI